MERDIAPAAFFAAAGRLDAVLTNAADHTFYGAWMENASFIVIADGEFLIPRDGGSDLTIPGRAAAAGGERESGLPAVDVRWRSLMVGTFQRGNEADDTPRTRRN